MEVKGNPNGISVIVCCYNSSSRLPETIAHLGRQNIPDDLPWEVIIINNASKDNTRQVAVTLCAEYLKQRNFSVVDENNPGLANARKRGIDAAKYEFLLFCDDDNWLFNDYVFRAYSILSADKTIGVVGGKSIGEYESAPPKWFLQNKASFAIGSQNAESGDITNKKGSVWGAGFTVRKSVYDILDNIGFDFILSGRNGDKLTSGEDRELCLVVRKLGYKIYYDDGLVLKHYMPTGRFNYESFLRLSEQNGRSSLVNDTYNSKTKNYPFYFLTTLLITYSKLTLISFIRAYYTIIGKASGTKVIADRRNAYFRGRLHILFEFAYARSVQKKVSDVQKKIQTL